MNNKPQGNFATLIVVLCFVASSLQAEQDPAAYPTGVDSQLLLREVWDISADHIYPAALAERFDSATIERLERQLVSDEASALADVLNPFLDDLGVSHTRFFDRRHQTYYMLRSLFATRDIDTPKAYTIGVQLNFHDVGRVRAVMQGSPAAAAGIGRGDSIVAVDGVPFESMLQWQQDQPVRLMVESGGEHREVQVDPVLQGVHRSLAQATAASRRVIPCADRHIGYLQLWSGTDDTFLQVLYDSVAAANDSGLDGFVLDLRDGYGGAWWPYLDPFFPDRDSYFRFTSFDSEGESEVVHAQAQENPDAWGGPLAVIINDGTRSGKESLAFQFKKSGRAKLFGTTTAGAFSAGRGVFVDRDADYIYYLSVAEFRLDGTVIEGVGVSPDVIVHEAADRDAPLQAALEHLGCNSG